MCSIPFTSKHKAKEIARNELQTAVDNLLTAERNGASQLAPQTYRWAKKKIYKSRKLILKNHNNESVVNKAKSEAFVASDKLLKKLDEVAIRDFVNEGGTVI